MHPPARRSCNPSQNRFLEGRGRQSGGLLLFGPRERQPFRRRVIAREDATVLQPSEHDFEKLAAGGFNLIPVFEEVAADLETPVSAFLKVARDDYAFLLESVRGGEKWGRYTFLGSEPSVVMRARKNRMDIIR